ncbi:serine/threonine-protein kinase PINK1, mitochondrial isoform X2 [Heterodontus francisci]|uniref:serine/threonine-protein kinase PINK1, mitochondrial isoform X2 n=1 Tax=Heterodontus francisci TaxID=7792 RepID=UPI00355B6154
MSVRRFLARGLKLGRSALRLFTPAARNRGSAAFVRSWAQQPLWAELPARYRYFRLSVGGLAAQLRRRALRGPGGALLAFGLGLGFIEQQVEEVRRSTAACQEIQTLIKRKKIKYENSVPLRTRGYRFEDYKIGHHIGKGCNAAVYKAFISGIASPKESNTITMKEKLQEGNREGNTTATVQDVSSGDPELRKSIAITQEKSSLSFVILKRETSTDPQSASEGDSCYPLSASEGDFCYPLALKMLWNIKAGSSSDAILRAMGKELVPTIPNAFTGEFGRTKGYPCTLRQYLQICSPTAKYATLMILQLLEGVDHLVQHSIAHRDLKSDNILVEFDSVGCPRLVITDFGCCLAEETLGLRLPFTSMDVDRGGNSCLMAPEISTAVPGPNVTIDYSKSDAWSVGTLAYEILGLPNPFYGCGMDYLESRNYQENKLPPLPGSIHRDVKLGVKLLLCRDPKRRLSARVAANMLHLHLWGAELLASAQMSVDKVFDWLRCQTLLTCLQVTMSCELSVETELKRSFLANLSFEELKLGLDLLLHGKSNL